MKILLVDDDMFLRDMYATKFAERGDEVDSVESPAEALKKAQEGDFDVVLMDMVMPGMNGIELLKAFKELKLAKEPSYIVLSNQGEEADIEAARSEGISGYIVKAESIPSEVVEKVHQLVS